MPRKPTMPEGPLPNRIAEFRVAKGWSVEKLGRMIGKTGSQVNKLEKGEIKLNIDALFSIAEALECAPMDLLPQKRRGAEEEAFLELFRLVPEEKKETVFNVLDGLAEKPRSFETASPSSAQKKSIKRIKK